MSAQSSRVGRRPSAFAGAWRAEGFPWCDVCRKPAVQKPGLEARHATVEHPDGVQFEADPSGHRVSITQWAAGEQQGAAQPRSTSRSTKEVAA
ncbi:hypothetical protein [Kineosporia sp. R_H_3]|uniref:hypothetical protein n=1 Tax=Kineosporia sp. R_H_3 TaxID=1961848 RepID=UPI000B4B7E6E|nr:hypothetical protein [Kineosporia sp. R_H_3]